MGMIRELLIATGEIIGLSCVVIVVMSAISVWAGVLGFAGQ